MACEQELDRSWIEFTQRKYAILNNSLSTDDLIDETNFFFRLFLIFSFFEIRNSPDPPFFLALKLRENYLVLGTP